MLAVSQDVTYRVGAAVSQPPFGPTLGVSLKRTRVAYVPARYFRSWQTCVSLVPAAVPSVEEVRRRTPWSRETLSADHRPPRMPGQPGSVRAIQCAASCWGVAYEKSSKRIRAGCGRAAALEPLTARPTTATTAVAAHVRLRTAKRRRGGFLLNGRRIGRGERERHGVLETQLASLG